MGKTIKEKKKLLRYTYRKNLKTALVYTKFPEMRKFLMPALMFFCDMDLIMFLFLSTHFFHQKIFHNKMSLKNPKTLRKC